MENATQTGAQPGDPGVGKFTVFADFSCPFCYALNERLHVFNLQDRIDFRPIQHAPTVCSSDVSIEVLGELSREVGELRRRTPSTQINVPMFRPNSRAASALLHAVSKTDPDKSSLLRRDIYRALWIDGQDISSAEVLADLVRQLDIELPVAEDIPNDELSEWQDYWSRNHEFGRNIPIVISNQGESVIGFPLEPELDQFLNTGSLISDNFHSGRDYMNRVGVFILLAGVMASCGGCSVFRQSNRRTLNCLNEHVSFDSTAGKIAAAPVFMPVGWVAVATDAIIINPAVAVPDAYKDTKELVWENPEGSGFRQAMLFLPKVVVTPVVYIGDWVGRVLFPIEAREDGQ